jgi:cell division protein FtsQ
VVALSHLLEAAPALNPQVREAEWVGNRRWNITFKTGQVLALPEGEQASAKALMSFARLDGTNRLLGGRVAAFDMRASDRIYLRVPDRGKDEESPAKPAAAKSANATPAATKTASADSKKTASAKEERE